MKTNRKRDRRGNRRSGESRRSDSPIRRDWPKPPCAMCGEVIKDISSALATPSGGEPVHFDCALKAATDKLNPGEAEKVIYLGKGSFAVVEARLYQQRKLKIVRTLDWENLEEQAAWRQELRAEIP